MVYDSCLGGLAGQKKEKKERKEKTEEKEKTEKAEKAEKKEKARSASRRGLLAAGAPLRAQAYGAARSLQARCGESVLDRREALRCAGRVGRLYGIAGWDGRGAAMLVAAGAPAKRSHRTPRRPTLTLAHADSPSARLSSLRSHTDTLLLSASPSARWLPSPPPPPRGKLAAAA